MKAADTKMFKEAHQAPTVVEQALQENKSEMELLGSFLRRHRPPFVLTVHRATPYTSPFLANYYLQRSCTFI